MSTDGGETYLAAARALGPRIRAAREQIEAERRLPEPLVAALTAAGLFRLSMPRDWGGPEVDPLTQLRVVEALSIADGSVGWCAMLYLHGGYFAAYLEDAVGRGLYADLDALTCAVVRPSGRAEVVPGGYLVGGRWTYGSGCLHSVWLASNCQVFDPGADAPRETRLCYLPRESVEILDTWTTTGLRGTGSHDYTAERVFVPAERTFSLERAPVRRPEPLYGLRNLYLANVGAVPLGIARAAIEAVVELAGRKTTRIGSGLRDEAHVQTAIARAEALVGSARAFLFEVVGEIWAGLLAGRSADARRRALYRLALCQAFSASVEAVDLLYTVAGGSALYTSHPLERFFRDVHAGNQHFSISAKVVEAAGRALLGLEPEVPGF